MARLLSRRMFGALAGALCTSCFGQTGQPLSGPGCKDKPVAADETWNGQTVREWVQALAGPQVAELLWWTGRGTNEVMLVALEDRLSITLTHPGTAATDYCWREQLDVPVEVTLSSEASGISEHGPGVLTFTSTANPLSAELVYSSERLALSVTLTAIAEQQPPVGELTDKQGDLPSPYAQVTEEP